jgi:enoyl-CoA hydratase/carnithine racemase
MTEQAVETTVASSVEGSALWLRINRPDALNSLSLAVIDELHAGLDRAEADPAVRSVVLTGTGRAFCAGADLKDVNDSDSGVEFRRLLGVLLDRIDAFAKPVIAAVNGIALAGGLELILCCDVVVAAASARMGDGHSNYGLLPGGGGSVRLPRVVGKNRAMYMLYTGDLFPAADLQAWGLVNVIAADEGLHEAVTQLTDRLSAKSPLGLARMKQLVHETAEQPTPTALSLELLYSALHEKSHDMAEGVAAFVEKRKPEFNGR